MFLSKVTLMALPSLADTLLKLDKNDAYASHQLLWREMFHHDETRQFIYRQDMDKRKMLFFYVLSQQPPERYSDALHIETKAFNPKIQAGQRLAYTLRVNPTISTKSDCGRSQRHDVLMHTKRQYRQTDISPEDMKRVMNEAVQQWMCNEKRLTAWGIQLATVPDVKTYTQHKSYKRKRGEKEKAPIQFSSVDVQGVLTVTEPEKFIQQYALGFGRQKSMGCGLMLIRGISCPSSP